MLKSLLPDSLLHPERFSLLMTKQESLESEIGLSAGYLGNLKLTFATVGTFTASKRFLFFKLDGGFYVRKDITEVTYGSQLSGLQVDSPVFDLGPPKVTLVFEEPDLIAVNRYIDLLAASSKFVYIRGTLVRPMQNQHHLSFSSPHQHHLPHLLKSMM